MNKKLNIIDNSDLKVEWPKFLLESPDTASTVSLSQGKKCSINSRINNLELIVNSLVNRTKNLEKKSKNLEKKSKNNDKNNNWVYATENNIKNKNLLEAKSENIKISSASCKRPSSI